MDKALSEPYHEIRAMPTIYKRAKRSNILPSGAGARHANRAALFTILQDRPLAS